MKVVSFDIGIKHMACCTVTLTPNVSIDSWTVLNLLEPPLASSPLFCTVTLKNKRTCGKKARYTKNDATFCEVHSKTASPLVRPSRDTMASTWRKQTLEQLQNHQYAALLSTVRTKKDALEKLQQWARDCVLEKVETVIKPSAKDADLIQVGRTMAVKLDAMSFEDVTHVILENQISPLAARMRALQGMLTQYFILRYPAAHIVYMSSANKLRLAATPPTTTTTHSGYQKHKSDAVDLCRRILVANSDLGFTLESMKALHAKQDDLADSFLQALWYLQHDLKIIYLGAEDLKIKCVVG